MGIAKAVAPNSTHLEREKNAGLWRLAGRRVIAWARGVPSFTPRIPLYVESGAHLRAVILGVAHDESFDYLRHGHQPIPIVHPGLGAFFR